MVFAATPGSLPNSTILPSLTPTSPRKAGSPEPSTMRPFLISRSYAIGFPPRCGSPERRPARPRLYHATPASMPAFTAWVGAEPCAERRYRNEASDLEPLRVIEQQGAG